jgi:hypothetical protein
MQRSSVRLHPSTQIRAAEVATSEVRGLCLPAIAHVSPAQNSSVHRRSRDGAVIGQSCLHSPAKIVVERQSQPTGSSLSALEPRQTVRKPRERTVLPAAAYCAKDPRAALNRQTHTSNMPLMAPDRAPSEVTRSVCLQSPTSPCPLVLSFLTGGVSYSVLQDAQQSSDDPICIGPSRRRSA